MLSAVSHTVVRRPSGATAGLITVEFNYELSYITTESLISIHPLAPLTRWYHAVCAQSAYRREARWRNTLEQAGVAFEVASDECAWYAWQVMHTQT